ncbi:MAG: hypothetical protein E7254_11065 [Lachnospiraceae bacterium]|nr:hypothetical protein [Lachnospiraceae bacterium]
MDKIKLGKFLNKFTTVVFIAWIFVIFFVRMKSIKTYLIVMGIIFVLFSAGVIGSNICLKDYKEDKYTEKREKED